MAGMVVGVGIALGIGMTLIAINKASFDIFAGDYVKSGANLYVVAEGGNPHRLPAGRLPRNH